MKMPFCQTVEGRKTRVEGTTPVLLPAQGFRRPSVCPGLRPSTFNLQTDQRGIALVITLILLSVTLVMAVAFLALSRRDRSSVATTTDTATARLAAESALAQAQAQIAANALAVNSYTNAGLLVSTNYINYYGFDGSYSGSSPTNVNFDYTVGGAVLTLAQFNQSVANLQILPRVPVYQTNYLRQLVENSFYLDLNRNGIFDTNNWAAGTNTYGPGDPEWIGVLERPDALHSPNNRFTSRYAFIAIPADGALDLNYIHNQAFQKNVNGGPTGPFVNDSYLRNQSVGTWELNLAAFLTDLNTNEWDPVVDPYIYNPLFPPNRGRGFEDALAILSWRYNFNYGSLQSAEQVFPNLNPNNAATIFPIDGIDNYSDGPLQTNFDTNADFPPLQDNPALSWVGANNTNHYYNLPSDAFDTTKAPSFAADLQTVNQSYTLASPANADPTNYYNRYTLYRMLQQLGTDSHPDQGKINLNYSNATVNYNFYGVATNVSITPGAETNLVPWRPIDFFTIAADRMLRMYTTNWFQANPSNYFATYYGLLNFYYAYTNSANNNVFAYSQDGFGLTNTFFGTNTIPAFGITNIPVYLNGVFVYSPAVNRVLQQAANLYDATTTNFYPTVFRPIFTNDGVNLFICGYQQVKLSTPPVNSDFGTPWQNQLPLGQAIDPSLLLSQAPGIYSNNVYGVPWIIGAKKHLPGMNQFSMVNAAQVTRRLQVARQTYGGPIWTNQMYAFDITNYMGISFWNAYANNYPTNYGGGVLNMAIYVSDAAKTVLTNSAWGTGTMVGTFATNFIFRPSSWPGSTWGKNGLGTPNLNSFFTANWTNTVLPDSSVYNFTKNQFITNSTALDNWDTNRTTLDELPQLGLLTTNWVQAIIVDNTNVIDYVQLRGPINATNLTSALADPVYPDPFITGELLWSTNLNSGGVPWGVINQLTISSTAQNIPASARWIKPSNYPTGIPDGGPVDEAAFFRSMFTPNSAYQVGGIYYTNYQTAVQAPYTPSRTIYVPYLLQINDPLVHYLVSDLDSGTAGVWSDGNAHQNGLWVQDDDLGDKPLPTPPSINIVKGRYQPWGKKAQTALISQNYNFGNPDNLIYKDPLVWSPDFWDFPTNLYPSVGWIGRVHRGTPWQTVYLKAENVLHVPGPNPAITSAGTNTWSAWTGDFNNYDAANSVPIQDRLLFDVFTAAPDANASYGRLSVNQDHLASWSAALSGLVVITNLEPVALLAGAATGSPQAYGWTNISPAGINGLNSALANIVTNINIQRAAFTNADGKVGLFEHVGDVLSTLQMTEHSPFLNWADPAEQNYGINDEAYEWLPQQAMSLLTCPAVPRYVVYCYGQTLKPAPNSLVTSASFFGLCTNYQVVAESAARAVIQVHPVIVQNPNGGFMTNFTTTVESYNVLPPN